MGPLFDTHAHYTDAAFDGDRTSLLDSLCGSGICAVVNCGSDLPSSRASLELAERCDFVFAACGIHPEEVDGVTDADFASLRTLLQNPLCVAVGEIGLDYHWRDDNKPAQKEVFARQLALAREAGLPVVIHDREAHEDTYALLREYRPQGVLHCYSGSAESAKELAALGLYFGIGGALTFKNARKLPDVVKELPPDRLLLETDCPYMAPVPHRGERNDSRLLPLVAERVAELKGMTVDEVCMVTAENAKRLFLSSH